MKTCKDCSYLARATKGSHNRYKLKLTLGLEYEKLTNRKHDTANKFVHKISTDNDLIAIQDENIKAWHQGLFGRKVQHSILGVIKCGLLRKPQTLCVERFFPSTKLCPCCSTLNVIGLGETVYSCPCGYSEDRDTHAAKNILTKALELRGVPMKQMPVEKKTSGFSDVVTKTKSLFGETGSLVPSVPGSSFSVDRTRGGTEC